MSTPYTLKPGGIPGPNPKWRVRYVSYTRNADDIGPDPVNIPMPEVSWDFASRAWEHSNRARVWAFFQVIRRAIYWWRYPDSRLREAVLSEATKFWLKQIWAIILGKPPYPKPGSMKRRDDHGR